MSNAGETVGDKFRLGYLKGSVEGQVERGTVTVGSFEILHQVFGMFTLPFLSL